MTLTAACLLLCLLGASLAAPTPGCNMPETWEGQLSMTVAQAGIGYSFGIMAESTIHFDSKNSKSAVHMDVSRDDGKGGVTKTDVVQDFASKKMYIINPAAKQCMVVDLPMLFSGSQPQDDNMKDLGKRTMGWGSQTFDVNVYEFTFSAVPMVLKQYQTSDCMPVMQQFRSTFNNVKSLQGQVFSNIVKGIKDPSVFDVPSYCSTPTPYDATNDVLNHVVAGQLGLRALYA